MYASSPPRYFMGFNFSQVAHFQVLAARHTLIINTQSLQPWKAPIHRLLLKRFAAEDMQCILFLNFLVVIHCLNTPIPGRGLLFMDTSTNKIGMEDLWVLPPIYSPSDTWVIGVKQSPHSALQYPTVPPTPPTVPPHVIFLASVLTYSAFSFLQGAPQTPPGPK